MFRTSLIAALLCVTSSLTFAQGGRTVFAPPVTYAAGSPTDVAAGDMDGDGDLDLVVGQFFVSGPMPIFYNDGSGGFTLGGFVPGLTSVTEVELADLNGDGAADLVIRQSANISVLLNNGDGSFGSPILLITGLNTPEITIADVDSDLDLDIVLSIHGTTTVPPQGVQLLVNDGNGGFSSGQFIPEENAGVQWAEVADINNDRLVDIVYATFAPTRLLATLATAPGAFGHPYELYDQTISGLSLSETWALSDVTADGHPDVLWMNPFFFALEVSVIVNAGDGTFGPPVITFVAPSPTGTPFLAVGELNGHGSPEVLATLGDSAFATVLSGPGDGSMATDVIIDGLSWVSEPLFADLDGDGDDDLAMVDTSQQQLIVLINHSYPAGSPFTDLGFALPSSTTGHPIVLASGTPIPGQTLAFDLFNGAPSAAAALFVGITAIHAPFKGGVMVPNPDAVFIPLTTDAAGELPLSATWPLGPGNYTFWAQYWIVDPTGPAGFTASTAVRTEVP